MMIRMTIAVPLEYLHATVKFFDKNSIVIRGTEFAPGNGVTKRRYLTDEQRKQIAAIKDRARGRAVVVANEYGVSDGVIRKIWA
jgi:hypothetical protein